MKKLLLLTLILFLFPALNAKAQKTKNPPVDKIVILIEDYVQGVKTIRTVIIDFDTYPTSARECKDIAEEYDDFTGLDGIALCYYQGTRLVKYKL